MDPSSIKDPKQKSGFAAVNARAAMPPAPTKLQRTRTMGNLAKGLAYLSHSEEVVNGEVGAYMIRQ